jgi:hypothetical protein
LSSLVSLIVLKHLALARMTLDDAMTVSPNREHDSQYLARRARNQPD